MIGHKITSSFGQSLAILALIAAASSAPTGGDAVALQKRDITKCPSTNTVAYSAAYSLVQQVAEGNPGFLNSGQTNAIQYNGAWVTYCNYGYGTSIDSTTVGNALYNMIDTCWNQQQQDANAQEAGQYIIYMGDTLAGYLCLSNARNPSFCNC
jgi:hypothetical protein